LTVTFFNYRSQTATSWWERRSFITSWWRIYARDPYWVPPYYPGLHQLLKPGHDRHLNRMSPLLIHTEALSKRRHKGTPDPTVGLWEVPMAATVALGDPRRQDRTAYLGLLRCINEPDGLKRLLEYVAEALRPRGYRQVFGPTGLSPHLNTGLLQDTWNQIPPLHTPSNPPYLPEIADIVMRPVTRSQLYHLPIPPDLPSPSPAPADLLPLDPARLATDLLPLLVAACPSSRADFVPPDTEEATFLLRRLGRWPLFGRLAQVDGQPVGFVLLQPDLAPRLLRAGGGRQPLWRLWLAWSSRRPATHGRLLFGAVLPEWRGQGIGRQLLYQALRSGQEQGWQSLSVGPVPTTAPGGKFLKAHGAEARQSYMLYRWEF
jgi:GNAT superfamily N-acetyltransferase